MEVLKVVGLGTLHVSRGLRHPLAVPSQLPPVDSHPTGGRGLLVRMLHRCVHPCNAAHGPISKIGRPFDLSVKWGSRATIRSLIPWLPSASFGASLDPLRQTVGRAEAGATRRVKRATIPPPQPNRQSGYGHQGQARCAGGYQGLSKSSLRVRRGSGTCGSSSRCRTFHSPSPRCGVKRSETPTAKPIGCQCPPTDQAGNNAAHTSADPPAGMPCIHAPIDTRQPINTLHPCIIIFLFFESHYVEDSHFWGRMLWGSEALGDSGAPPQCPPRVSPYPAAWPVAWSACCRCSLQPEPLLPLGR